METPAAFTMPPPDGSGGAGSYPGGLWQVITGGLGAIVSGELNARYGAGALAERAYLNADGKVRPASSPGTPAPSAFVAGISDALKNPNVLMALAAAAGLVVILVLARR